MEELIRQARGGDAAARSALLEHLRPQVRAWAERAIRSRFASRRDASDLTQETLLDVHRKLEQFLGSTESELTQWVLQVLRNNILDAIRRETAQKRNIDRELSADQSNDGGGRFRDQLAGDQSSPSMGAIRNEEQGQLASAMQALTAKQREAVQLIYLQGLKVEEAAQQMELTPAAAAKQLQRGMAKLRKVLDSE